MADVDSGTRDLDAWLAPFLDVLGRKTRRTWAPFYLRGLLGPGERKSLQPMAARLGLSGHDQLQHFIASPAWDDGPLWRVLSERADRLVGGPGAVLVVDDTALPKKGALSVGVARQYCGQLGEKASCQALVSLTLAGREVPVPVGLRLFLPERWTADPARCAAAGVPEAEVLARSKGEIALAELEDRRAVRGRGAAVLRAAGREGQLQGAGFTDARRPGGAGARGAAPVPAREVDRRSRALRGGRRAGGRGPGPQQGRDRPGRAGPPAGGGPAVRPCAGRCRLRRERRVPPRAGRAGPALGGGHPAQPEGLRRGRPAGPARRPQAAPGAGPGAPRGRGGAGRVALAPGHLAAGHQRSSRGSLRGGPHPGR